MSLFIKSTFLLSIVFCGREILGQELPCFENFSESESQFRVENIIFKNSETLISGNLYLPVKRGNYPALILMPGGGNNVINLRDVPVYLAKRAAKCGIVSLVYDKRGTGESKGNFFEADFNDFLSDASVGVDFLATHTEVNSNKIGAAGFSQGGRLIANLAVRNTKVSFIASVSGPIYPVGLTRYYALKNSLGDSQLSDSTQAFIMPYWEEHFKALEARDPNRYKKLEDDIQKASQGRNRNLFPPNLKDVEKNPIYNSMGLDLLTELRYLEIPWFSIYGANDIVVPVQKSIDNINRLMKISGNQDYRIEVIPNSSHALYNADLRQSYPFEAEIIKWVLNQAKN